MNFFGIESLRDLFTLYFEITHKFEVILHCAWPRRHEQTHKSAVILQFIRLKPVPPRHDRNTSTPPRHHEIIEINCKIIPQFIILFFFLKNFISYK